MESYIEFLNRINSFETSKMSLYCDNFVPNSSVALKVNENNSFSSFYGDTVVFDLDDREKNILTEYIRIIYREAAECFCEQLSPSTLHLTLHDLSNSPILEDIAGSMKLNEQKLLSVLSKNKIPKQTIRMRSKAVFNMVNTSLVAGFYPTDETEYNKLMKLYETADEVRSLSYPLTPHITLAYYNRNGFDNSAVKKLEKTVSNLNGASFEIVLDTDKLVYQKFSSMNNYENVFFLTQI